MSKPQVIKEGREFHFTHEDFEYISKIVGEKVGIVLHDHKKDMVYSRIARRLRALSMKTCAQYIQYLQTPQGDEEITNFVNAITTNLTKFFRESHHFDHLADLLKEEAKNNPGGKKLRIWSAGCSSGMEGYSIAMTARENIANIDRWNFKILATDIDTNMLNTGKTAIYKKTDLEGVPKHLHKKYVSSVATDDKMGELSNSLKKLISFKRLNLLEKWPMKGIFDIIFCRNVVIYFDKETQKILFNRYADHLPMGGWLYIGHSENLSNVCDRFELIGRTIYRKVK